MLLLVEQHLPQLAQLCHRYKVRRLELFGSAARDTYDPAASDLDFLVLFQPAIEMNPADRYFGLLEDLQILFGRKVDLVDVKGARNPYFMAEALKHRVMLYAA